MGRVKGSSLFGEALRAVIVYVILLVAVYLVGLANAQAGTWLTLILILLNVGYLLKISDATKRFVIKQFPSVLATAVIAYVLNQPLDYAFSVIFLILLAVRLYELYS